MVYLLHLSSTSVASPTFTAPNYNVDLSFGLVLEYTDNTVSSEGDVIIRINNIKPSFFIYSATTSTAVREDTATFSKINDEALNIYFSVDINSNNRYIPTTTMSWTSEHIGGEYIPLFNEDNNESPIFTIPASVTVTSPIRIRISAHYEIPGYPHSRTSVEKIIDIIPPNDPPVARYTYSVLSTTDRTIQLDASTSSDDGSIISYSWFVSFFDYRNLIFSNNTIVNPILTVDSRYTKPNITLYLYVTDNLNVQSEQIQITIPNPFLQSSPPSGTTGGAVGALGTTVIFAGHNQLVYSSEEVTLTAEIFNDIKIITYSWIRVGGNSDSSIILLNDNTATATFTADTLSIGDDDIIHTFLLTVTDDNNNVYSDSIEITVRDISLKPLGVNSGLDQTVNSNNIVTLNGSNSYIPSDINVTYKWTILENKFIEITNGNQISASFIAPIVTSTYPETYKVYTAKLTITDDNGNVYTDTTLINVNRQSLTENAPVARISPNTLTVSSGEQVTLDGSTSFDFENGTIVSYRWERIGGTSEEDLTFTGENTNTLIFTAETLDQNDESVSYVIRLIVEDDLGNSDDDTITINVIPSTGADGSSDSVLSANAGINQYTYSESTVQLDGSKSRGAGLTYLWQRTGGTGNPNIMLSDPNIVNPTFIADRLTTPDINVTHLYRLTITDSDGNTDSSNVKITIYSI